ncbi:MAG: gluconate 2-dehydrogenase subunit 3 family protein [Leadbetterella sp.]|nr:gluconate 2-dehydrogenase subunit 3 family protein [Leadbetterella sp.]
MNRRKLLKSVALSLGSGLVLPNWANAWNSNTWQKTEKFTVFESDMISEIAATFIPEGEVLGAKGVEVDKFLTRLFADCYIETDIQKIKNGIQNLDKSGFEKYKASFLKCSNTQKESLLMEYSSHTDEEKKWFFNTMKGETVRGYTTSEYVMTKYYNYVIAPGDYKGCIDIKQ